MGQKKENKKYVAPVPDIEKDSKNNDDQYIKSIFEGTLVVDDENESSVEESQDEDDIEDESDIEENQNEDENESEKKQDIDDVKDALKDLYTHYGKKYYEVLSNEIIGNMQQQNNILKTQKDIKITELNSNIKELIISLLEEEKALLDSDMLMTESEENISRIVKYHLKKTNNEVKEDVEAAVREIISYNLTNIKKRKKDIDKIISACSEASIEDLLHTLSITATRRIKKLKDRAICSFFRSFISIVNETIKSEENGYNLHIIYDLLQITINLGIKILFEKYNSTKGSTFLNYFKHSKHDIRREYKSLTSHFEFEEGKNEQSDRAMAHFNIKKFTHFFGHLPDENEQKYLFVLTKLLEKKVTQIKDCESDARLIIEDIRTNTHTTSLNDPVNNTNDDSSEDTELGDFIESPGKSMQETLEDKLLGVTRKDDELLDKLKKEGASIEQVTIARVMMQEFIHEYDHFSAYFHKLAKDELDRKTIKRLERANIKQEQAGMAIAVVFTNYRYQDNIYNKLAVVFPELKKETIWKISVELTVLSILIKEWGTPEISDYLYEQFEDQKEMITSAMIKDIVKEIKKIRRRFAAVDFNCTPKLCESTTKIVIKFIQQNPKFAKRIENTKV